MPDFKDLKDIKEKIDNIGDEKKIIDEKGLPSEDLPLPEEKKSSSKEDLEQTSPPNIEDNSGNEEEDLLGDILEDFEKGHIIQDENVEDAEATFVEEEKEETDSEELKDLLADTELKDEGNSESIDKGIEDLLSGGIEESVTEEEKAGEVDETGLGFDEESEIGDFEKMQDKSDTGEEIGDFDNFFEEGAEKADESSVGDDELDALLKQPLDEEPITGMEEEVEKADELSVGDDELDALLKQPTEEEKGMLGEEESRIDTAEDIPEMPEETGEVIPQDDKKNSGDEILEKLGEKETESKLDDLPDLESLLGEEKKEADISNEELEGILGEEGEGKKGGIEEDFEMPDFIAEETKEPEGLEGFPTEDGEGIKEELSEDFEMPDFSGEMGEKSVDHEEVIGEEFQEPVSAMSEGLDISGKEEEFDLGMIGEEGTESVGEQPQIESKEEEISDIEGFEIKDSSFGEIPEEISKEDLKVDQDIKIDLTDDERKQILISLTSLPKDAELKISKAIVSNKYSNTQLKPLINALIDKESPHIIIKYYEKITGDKSLSAIEGVKYTGVKFEERKKTISYIFEKNILPLLAKISVLIVIGVLIFLASKYIIHTWQITKLYKEGLKLIDNKYYDEGEAKFQKAFKDQPRFREVVKYARKYRGHKRYMATEGKYELAVNMRSDNNNIVLEYSDFLREKKDFERAERMYNGMIKTDRSKLQATLGLAKTYYDWAEEETGKLEDAKDAYKDALEMDRNNKEAIFGNLRINIKQKNDKAILNHYNYIEKNFKRNVDPEAYSELAKYFMSTDKINEVKNVLDRASKSLKKKDLYPEIQYQYARYKKQLSIFDEEEKHLKNALSIFERMKNEQTGKYESNKYQKLLANVYNDLGENAEVSIQANPEAEKYYIKAIEIYKGFGKPYYNLANFALKYKPGGYREAKENYLKAESNGFINDRLNYNLGWLYYKEGDYMDAYNRINRVFEKQPENSNLKFMIGTIFYKLGKYELSESILLENYLHFMDLKAMYEPLDTAEKEDKVIMEMLKKVSNNLGAAYQKKYEETLNSKYIVKASKYYADSILYFDKLENIYVSEVDVYSSNIGTTTSQLTDKKGYANINLRMVLFPYAGVEQPILYEDFPFDFNIFM